MNDVMNDVKYKFHEDLEKLTSPTDRIPTVQMSAMVKQRLQESQEETIYTEQKTLSRGRHRGEPIFARTPLIIFFGIFAFYALLFLRGVDVLLYVMVMVGSRLMK